MAHITLEDLPVRPPAPEELDDDALEDVAGGWTAYSYSVSWWSVTPLPIPQPGLVPLPIPMPGATPISIP